MALISLRQMLDHAAEYGYGVPAFNVNNMEQMHAIMQAADETNSPVIVQASAGARSYAGAPFCVTSSRPLSNSGHTFRCVCTKTMVLRQRCASVPFNWDFLPS